MNSVQIPEIPTKFNPFFCLSHPPTEAKKIMALPYLSLINNADIEYLYESVMAGIPEEAMATLGEKVISVEDLLLLPRKSSIELCGKGVYIDFIITNGELYVCIVSATGKYGVLQRWGDYRKGTCDREYTMHSTMVPANIQKINLRALA